MEVLVLVVLMLALWPASFAARGHVPPRMRLFISLFLAFVSIERFVLLARGGGEPIATMVFAVIAVIFLVDAWRWFSQRRRARTIW